MTSVPPTGSALRIARQHALTTRLLGVDFMPLRAGGGDAGAPDSDLSESSETTTTRAPATSVGRAAPSARAAALDELRRLHDEQCLHCSRAKGHKQTVFADGNPDAALMFVGEAPGAEEDRIGLPFVGRAGQKLDDMIRAMGLERKKDVYICNVLKARPPENATPTPEEMALCGPWLVRQIEIVQPKVIVALGRVAASYLLETTEALNKLRGRWFEFKGIPVMPTFHPAFLLRQYTPENRRKVWSDLQAVSERLTKQVQ